MTKMNKIYGLITLPKFYVDFENYQKRNCATDVKNENIKWDSEANDGNGHYVWKNVPEFTKSQNNNNDYSDNNKPPKHGLIRVFTCLPSISYIIIST